MYYYKQQTNRVKIPQNEKTYVLWDEDICTMRCVKLQPILCLKFLWLSQLFFFKLGNSKRFLTSSDLFEECNHCFVFVLGWLVSIIP